MYPYFYYLLPNYTTGVTVTPAISCMYTEIPVFSLFVCGCNVR